MISVGDAIREFVNSCEADGLSRATIKWYGHFLASLQQAQPLSALTNKEIRARLVQLRQARSAHTVLGAYRTYRRFARWCRAEYPDLAEWNPIANIREPRVGNTTPRGVEIDDVIRLLAVTGDGTGGYRNRAIILLLMDTGCRAAGLLNAKIGDLDIRERTLVATEKGNKSRITHFTEYTGQAVEQWLMVRPQSEWLICSLQKGGIGLPLTYWGLHMMFRHLKSRAGIKGRVNPHSFRHGFARAMLMNGADLATVSRLMGHASVEITAKFYALFTDRELAQRHEAFSPVHNLVATLK